MPNSIVLLPYQTAVKWVEVSLAGRLDLSGYEFMDLGHFAAFNISEYLLAFLENTGVRMEIVNGGGSFKPGALISALALFDYQGREYAYLNGASRIYGSDCEGYRLLFHSSFREAMRLIRDMLEYFTAGMIK